LEEEEGNTIMDFSFKNNKYLFTSIGTKRFREYLRKSIMQDRRTRRICSDKQRKRISLSWEM